MLDLLKTETMVSKNPATSAFGLGSLVFRDHSLGFKKVYPRPRLGGGQLTGVKKIADWQVFGKGLNLLLKSISGSPLFQSQFHLQQFLQRSQLLGVGSVRDMDT